MKRKPLPEIDETAVKLAILLAQTAQSDLVHDGRKVRCLTLKHTIERLGSIQNLLQSVLLQ